MKQLVIAILVLHAINISAQENVYKFWVQLKDKEHNEYSLSNPEAFLSQRSLERRLNQDINIDITDLPVSSVYLDSLAMEDLEILYTSKWLNAVVIQTGDSLMVTGLEEKSFVSSTEYLYRNNLNRKSGFNKFNETFEESELPSDHQDGGRDLRLDRQGEARGRGVLLHDRSLGDHPRSRGQDGAFLLHRRHDRRRQRQHCRRDHYLQL